LASFNAKVVPRILRILAECTRSPFDGIGKPEPLKHNNQGLWSRRMSDEDRIV
jgi:toxin YoeB